MSPFEQEIQELREEVTTLRGEVERLSALVTILVATQGQPTLSSPASFQTQTPDVTILILTKVANTPQHMPVLYGLDEVPLPHVSEVPTPMHLIRRSGPTDGPREKEQRVSIVNSNAATVIPIIKAARNLGHQSTATVIPVFHAAQKHVATVTPVIKVAQMICYGAAVIILIILGVKFISAAPDGKAQIKERMVPAIAGAVFLFAIGSIIRIVGGFAVNTI